MANLLVHPKMLESLADFYPSVCAIQYDVGTADTYGQPIEAWVGLLGHDAIPCAVAPSGGEEVRQADMTYVVTTHRICLRGSYPMVKEAMRAVIAGSTYDLLVVEHDSHTKTTGIAARIVA